MNSPQEFQSNLKEGYEIRLMSGPEFGPLFNEYRQKLFAEDLMFQPSDACSPDELEKVDLLRKNFKDIVRIRLGLYFENHFVGWSWGYQQDVETFYMCNSAVFPEHRRKGLYTALLERIMKEAMDLGFQRLVSRHNTTNNAVIIPKLKAGFVITQLEVSEIFGTLVHLCFYPNDARNKVMKFRSGQMRPDAEINRLLKL